MSANASSLFTLNPIIVYATLGLYGLLFAFMFVYLHSRFRKANRVLALLQTDWANADTEHKGLLETAQDHIAQLARVSRAPRETPAPPQAMASPAQAITSDARAQVVAMGRKGFAISEISRSIGLPEGEVDVLLGLARMER